MVNPLWLRTFCALVEVGHFTRTAERLHMTQSGVSQHVRKLEEQLGVALLIRHGRRFSLTDAGERLYREGQQLVEALTSLKQRVGDDPPHAGQVRLMSPGSVGLNLYPRLLTLQQQHPALVIDHRFAPNADIERAVADGVVDIGLLTRPATRNEVSCRPIGREALLLVTPAGVEDNPDWSELMQLGFIDHPDGGHHAGLLLSENYPQFEHIGQFPTKGFSNQISLILEPVSRGLGFTVLPSYAVKAFPAPQRIKVHPLPNPVSETLYLGVHRHKPVPNRAKTVMAVIEHRL